MESREMPAGAEEKLSHDARFGYVPFSLTLSPSSPKLSPTVGSPRLEQQAVNHVFPR